MGLSAQHKTAAFTSEQFKEFLAYGRKKPWPVKWIGDKDKKNVAIRMNCSGKIICRYDIGFVEGDEDTGDTSDTEDEDEAVAPESVQHGRLLRSNADLLEEIRAQQLMDTTVDAAVSIAFTEKNILDVIARSFLPRASESLSSKWSLLRRGEQLAVFHGVGDTSRANMYKEALESDVFQREWRWLCAAPNNYNAGGRTIHEGSHLFMRVKAHSGNYIYLLCDILEVMTPQGRDHWKVAGHRESYRVSGVRAVFTHEEITGIRGKEIKSKGLQGTTNLTINVR